DEPGNEYRLVLTREGWLQPWVRTRKTEDDERKRLAAMPAFQTINQVGAIKPGAAILAEVRDAHGKTSPALVAQPLGRGQVGAMLVGDFWRWGMRRRDSEQDDFDRAWRQTVRWLVGEVPDRVEITVEPDESATSATMKLEVRVRDPEYRPLDNAEVTLRIKLPNGETITQ